jgi:hypothetical protein
MYLYLQGLLVQVIKTTLSSFLMYLAFLNFYRYLCIFFNFADVEAPSKINVFYINNNKKINK